MNGSFLLLSFQKVEDSGDRNQIKPTGEIVKHYQETNLLLMNGVKNLRNLYFVHLIIDIWLIPRHLLC